jgi:hypothetical protein
MVQHLVLMTLAAPLILLGEPALMFANSLPEHFDTTALDSLLRCVPIHEVGRVLADPVFCWLAGTVCVIVWHVPSAFDLCLQSEVWHGLRAGKLLRCWASFLVACRPTVAKYREVASVVCSPVFVPRHHTVRCALGISHFLRSRCLSRICIWTSAPQ